MTGKRPFFHKAAIYRFGDSLFVAPYARTRDGWGIGMAVLATASLQDARDIGMKVLAMLDKCEDDVPDDYTRGKAPLIDVILREVKLRTWGAFHKKALLVHVFREVGAPQMTITPTRREGGGSHDIDDNALISGIEPDEIGRAVLAALSLAK